MSVNATFHEDLTGKVASAQGSVSLHEMDVKLKFPDFNPGYFKPGLPFEVMVSRHKFTSWFTYQVYLSAVPAREVVYLR